MSIYLLKLFKMRGHPILMKVVQVTNKAVVTA